MIRKLRMMLFMGALAMTLAACGGNQETPEGGNEGQKVENTQATEPTKGTDAPATVTPTETIEPTATTVPTEPTATATSEATPTPLPNREFQGTTMIIRQNAGMNYSGLYGEAKKEWNDNKPLVEHIILEEGVTEIPQETFEGFTSLKKVTMADSVIKINAYAFRNCANLEEIKLSQNLTYVGKNVFDGTKVVENKDGYLTVGYILVGLEENMTEVVLPEEITLVAKAAFSDNETITSVVLHEKLKNPELPSFQDCPELVKVHLPSLYTELPEYLFENCKKLTTVNLPEGLTAIGDRAFYKTSIAEFVFPAGVRSVGIAAFCKNTALTSVIFQGDLDEIGNEAFAKCSALESVVVNGSVANIGQQIFAEDKDMKLFHVKGTVGNLDYKALNGGTIYYYLTSDIVIDGGVTGEIGEGAFIGCSGLKQLILADNVTSIGKSAFSATGLTSIIIPSAVVELKDLTFMNCEQLSSIVIPESVVTICATTFKDCKKLTIYGKAGSYAETFAKEKNIAYEIIE